MKLCDRIQLPDGKFVYVLMIIKRKQIDYFQYIAI